MPSSPSTQELHGSGTVHGSFKAWFELYPFEEGVLFIFMKIYLAPNEPSDWKNPGSFIAIREQYNFTYSFYLHSPLSL